MALLDNERNSNKKQSGTDKLLLGIIIMLVLAVILVIAFMMYFISAGETGTKQSIYLNGKKNDTLLNISMTQDEIMYLPIKTLAGIVGYEAYNGNYIYVSEDVRECHVIIANEEVVQFRVNSKEANKIKFGENLAYANVTLQNPIISIDNDLYISIEDVQNALYIYYGAENNIELYSLDSMYNLYNNYVIGLGYTELVNNFTNKKAILNDMLICKNSKNKYGVINSVGDVIVESKYDDIQYVEETEDLIVTYNGVKGIIQNQKTKIEISYDEIQYINYANMYAVTSNNKIGFFDIQGNKMIDFMYDEIGSKTGVKNAKSVKYIDTKGLLVVKNNGKYGLINTSGSTIVDFYLEDVYSTIFNGNLEYYVVTNGIATNLNSIV